MSDKLSNVKLAIWDFISNILIDADNGFDAEFSAINEQVFWEWTKSDGRSIFPYVYLEIESDEELGYGTFSEYEARVVDEVKKLYRIDKEFHVLTVAVNINSMSTGDNSLNPLEAQNQANAIARLLRRKFKSDEALNWFAEYANADDIPIGTQTEDLSAIRYIPDYEDTKVKHRFRFTLPFNWEETYETEVNLAQAAEIIDINGETVSIIINKP